jgi:hypothetical protein
MRKVIYYTKKVHHYYDGMGFIYSFGGGSFPMTLQNAVIAYPQEEYEWRERKTC